MRRALLLAVLVGASGCSGSRPKGATAPAPDFAAVKARAEVSLGDGTEVSPDAAKDRPKTEAPERRELEARKGRVLGTDPDGCTWVEGEATVVVGEQDTPHQAHASAVEQARAAAIQDFLGVDVNSKMMDFQQEGLRKQSHLTESLLQTTRNGRIIKERELVHELGNAADCSSCRYREKLQACVIPVDSTGDKGFRVEVGVSRARFTAGDEAEITVTATRDCTIYLYDVYDLGADAKTAVVVPNDAVGAKNLKAGETWTYPDAEAKARGVKLVAELPNPTDDVSAEVIRVVASKTALPKSIYDPADGGYLGVLRRLHRSKLEWTEDAQAYTIYRK